VKYLDVCSGVIYCYDFELEQWVRCGLTRNDLTEWPIDIFAGQALNDAGCSFGGFIGIDFERTLEGDTPVDIYDASNDAMVVLFQNPAIKRVRDSTDGWHVNWNDGRFTGQCLTFSEEFFGRSRSEYLLHVTHPWLTEAMHPCMSGRLSFDVAVAGAVLFEPPPIDLYATTSDVAPSSSLELIDAGMDASELQAAGYFRIPGEWHDLGGGQWRLDCWVPGFFFSGTETWLRLAGNIESLPGDENGGICSPTLQFPRDIGLAGSYQYNVFLIVSGPYAPDLSLNIWSEAYQILDETITYDLGPTIIEGEPFGQPSWTTPFHWSVPVPNEKGTYERDSGLRVKTRVGEEQTFTLPDEHGDAPWSQDFTTLLRFTHPGGGPTIPKSHIGFIWEGEQGYAEAWAEFGGLDFPQGVRVVGATSDFLPLTIATGMLHTLKMRVSNGRVYAKVWPDSDPEPTAWQVSALYDATRITGIAQLHIVVGAGIDDIFDPNAPMANSVFVQGLYGAIGPLPGQVIEDEPVGEGDGGTNEFPTEHPSNPASADIYVDGLHVVPVAFNPVTGGYVLDANPSPGAEVVIDYESA
jgi:hypothetical protein